MNAPRGAIDLGFTHLELLPLAQHPFEGSWGYQVTGQYAPNSRHGSPDDLRWFVDQCHAAGLGVMEQGPQMEATCHPGACHRHLAVRMLRSTRMAGSRAQGPG